MKPEFEALEVVFNEHRQFIDFIEVDASLDEDFKKKYNIVGYPMLKLFKPDGTVVDYDQGKLRTTFEMAQFLQAQTGTRTVTNNT